MQTTYIVPSAFSPLCEQCKQTLLLFLKPATIKADDVEEHKQKAPIRHADSRNVHIHIDNPSDKMLQSQRQTLSLPVIISSSIRLEQESDNDFYQTALQSRIKLPGFPPAAQSSVCLCVRPGSGSCVSFPWSYMLHCLYAFCICDLTELHPP